MNKEHNYRLTVEWTGNKGEGTCDYRSYERSHTISVDNKVNLICSSDTPFLGDNTKHNPEDFLLASISSCHMLWFLHLCADAGIIVVAYTDKATGTMIQTEKGGGHFTEVTLNPLVTVTEKSMITKANELHEIARERCFIANSLNFPVNHKPTCIITGIQ